MLADSPLGMVKADPGHIEQVILNLAVNARDAMPRGGQVAIEVRNKDVDEAFLREHPEATQNRYVMISVSDTGCGMDQATLGRVFEPFFSTKGESGTGLGLATVYGIMQQSGGLVSVRSEEGAGTTFELYLPRVDRAEAQPTPLATLNAIPPGAETVLVVEDDEAVRLLTSQILQGCGYQVLEAKDGSEALRIASAYPGTFDLLLTDVVMPRMAGPEMAEQMKALFPQLKTLFVSGYTDDAVMRHGIQSAQVNFLAKPFSPSALARKVREVLDSRGPSG
jgi:two-component system cell cycle sensor histidine kinase/response regulator CckA